MSNQARNEGKKLSTSLIIGLLLVPLSAVAAVALVNPDATAEAEDAAPVEVIAATSTTVVDDDFEVPEIASAEDLALACGDEGMALAAKEVDGTISALEQAALDSLRAICESEGLDLPGPPAPEAVVETVTVVAGPASTSEESGSSDDGLAAEFEEEYAETVAYINAAIADGARGDMIALAEELVGEAAALADSGDYEGGLAKLKAAREAADLAESGHHDDDDEYDDDDDYDDDDHDDDDDDHDDDDDDHDDDDDDHDDDDDDDDDDDEDDD